MPTPSLSELTRRLAVDGNRLALLRARTSSPATLETIARAEESNAALRSDCQRAAGIDLASRRRLTAKVNLQLRLTASLAGIVDHEQRSLS